MRFLTRFFRAVLDFILPQNALEKQARECTAEILFSRLSLREIGGVTALFSYRDPLIRHMVWMLKYKGDRRVAELFASVLRDVLLEDLAEYALFSPKEVLIIPIPLSKKRQRERGFNQMELVASQLSSHIPSLFYEPGVLRKIRNTRPQTELPKRDRLLNVRGAFSVARQESIRERAVLALDDVITTGATLREAERVLREAGVKSIHCIALTH